MGEKTENGRTFEIVAATNAFEDFQASSRVYADGDVHTAVRQVAKATFGDVSQLGLEKLLVTSLEEGKAQRARLGGGARVQHADESHVDVDDVLDHDVGRRDLLWPPTRRFDMIRAMSWSQRRTSFFAFMMRCSRSTLSSSSSIFPRSGS